jgi:glycosyltransferase involved in cell wall biosynthesis
MKLCFIVDYYPPCRLGGVGEAAFHLRRALLEKGHEVVVLTAGKKHDEDGPDVHRVCKSLLWFPFVIFARFPFYLQKHSFDVLNLHHSIAVTVFFWKHLMKKRFPASVSTFQCARPYIVRSIRPLVIGNKKVAAPTFREYLTKLTFTILTPADRYGARMSDMVTACSRDTRRLNREVHGIPADKIVAIFNGVDTGQFNCSVDGKPLRLKYKIRENEIVVAYVGGFSIRKRIPLVLHAVNEARKTIPSVKLMIVGSGKGFERVLSAMAASLDMKENIIFTGFVRNADLPAYYAASDIVVVPSEYEPFGIVNVEAMAMEKPVVASKIGGIDEIIEHGVSGLLVDKDDIGTFAKSIIELAGDPQRRKTIGLAAKKRVQSLFQWDSIAGSYERVYQEALNRRQRA